MTLAIGGCGPGDAPRAAAAVSPDIEHKSGQVPKSRVAKPPPPPAKDPAIEWRGQFDPQQLELRNAGRGQAVYRQDTADGIEIEATLDPVLQQAAEGLLERFNFPQAAIVVLDVQRANAVKVFAARSGTRAEPLGAELLLRPWSPSASVFKVVTAAGLLQHSEVTPQTRACYHGGKMGVPDNLLRDRPRWDRWCGDLSRAIARSSNVIIAKLAYRNLSYDALLRTTKQFRYGLELPFDLPVPVSPAEIPSDHEDRARVAAGFGRVFSSPLQAAVMASIVARGGIFQAPHMVRQVRHEDGRAQLRALPDVERSLPVDVAESLTEMMIGTTQRGTAARSFRSGRSGRMRFPGYEVAGKTGSLRGRVGSESLHHNWFVGFAPADQPELAFAVVRASRRRKSVRAHALAAKIIAQHLARRPDQPEAAELSRAED